MTLSTVLVSAAVSAIVGAIVSVLTISRVTVARVRAEKAEAALSDLRALVAPEIRKAKLYSEKMYSSLHREEAAHVDDAHFAAQALVFAQQVSRVRRGLIRRRVRALVGHEFFVIADLEALRPVPDASALMGLALGREFQARKGGRAFTRSDGLFQRAYMSSPSDPLVAKLETHLRRLARGR